MPHTPKLRAFLRKRYDRLPAAQLQRGTGPLLRNPQLSEGTGEIYFWEVHT